MGTSVFGADDEVGRDLAAVNWAATPLGDPAGWPQSLRTAVSILLSSRFSMWMAWGPELTFFCNAAYRRDTLGHKYPWALGRPAREVWAEIWHDIGPRIERVLATGEATWDEALLLFLERSGYPEETYHTFSYSPLRDDGGPASAMLCVVSEDTDRVIGERRMATLRDLGSDPRWCAPRRRCSRSRPDSSPATFATCRSRCTYLFDETAAHRWPGSAGSHAGHPAAPAQRPPTGQPLARRAMPARGAAALVDPRRGRLRRPADGAWPEPPARRW